jgi:hypothetical protein
MRPSLTTLLCAALMLFSPFANAQASESAQLQFSFASVEQGREILKNRDEFVRSLSPFDRAARLKSAVPVSESAYLDFTAGNVLAWTPEEQAMLSAALRALQPKLEQLALPQKQSVLIVKTSGKEEGGAAYTRGNAIMLNAHHLEPGKTAELQSLLSHELWHVLSRNHPAWKEKLYAAIGFQPCGTLLFPPGLQAQKLTNPDAPSNDHCIQVKSKGEASWAIPVLYASTPSYDTAKGGEFFDYLVFKLLLVQKPDTAAGSPRYDTAHPQLVEVKDVQGYFEQVGRNTGYIIHPEEIIADNVALLLSGDGKVASPELLARLKTILMRPQGQSGAKS